MNRMNEQKKSKEIYRALPRRREVAERAAVPTPSGPLATTPSTTIAR